MKRFFAWLRSLARTHKPEPRNTAKQWRGDVPLAAGGHCEIWRWFDGAGVQQYEHRYFADDGRPTRVAGPWTNPPSIDGGRWGGGGREPTADEKARKAAASSR